MTYSLKGNFPIGTDKHMGNTEFPIQLHVVSALLISLTKSCHHIVFATLQRKKKTHNYFLLFLASNLIANNEK